MYTIIDAETSGLFDFKRPADADGQPRLASFAMLAADADLNLIAATFALVQPDGWEMSEEAERVNGLSTELLRRQGMPVGEVLWLYAQEIMRGSTIVAHNAQFDTKLMRGEFRRAGMPDLYHQTQTICTMQGLVDVCAIPRAGGLGHKWPKLSEAVQICLKRELVGAHGALHDAMACLDLLRFMKAQGCMPQPLWKPASDR